MRWQGTDIFTDVDVNNEFIPGLSLNHTMYGVNWNIYIYIYYNVKVALCILLNLWKENLKSDGKKFHKLKKEPSPFTSNHWTQDKVGNPGPFMGQAHQYVEVELVYRISTLPSR
jgi:hypothetical protein